MHKNFLFGIFIVFLFSLGLICPVLAENFYIENYDVNIIVDKNKSADITEKIDVVFTSPCHGIYRDIPLKDASISNIEASEGFSTTYSPSNINLKIGSPNKLINGAHHYTIHYKYNYFDNKNEFYHNIIGTAWTVNTNKVRFNVTLPEAINPDAVGISIGTQGTSGFNGDAVYKVKDNKISGVTKRKLNPYEGITIRVEVPEGYFNKHENHTEKTTILGIILLTLIAFITWFVCGRDEKPIPVINFNVPDGLNAIEIELGYNGKCSHKGIVGLLVELAQKGYIKIKDDGHSWSLEKLKDYDGINKNESDLLNAIFKGYNKEVSKSSLSISTTFYKDCSKIISDTNKRRNQIFYEDSIGCSLQMLMGFCIIGILGLTIFATSGYNIFYILPNFFILLFPTIAMIVLFFGLKGPLPVKIFVIIWSIGFGGIPLAVFFGINVFSFSIFITGIVGLIITGICTYHLPKRNKAGQRIYNDLLGLKQFIEFAEKDRLKKLVEEDPEYFYKILPAAYIFGISDKWINKFESIMQINPDWYSGNYLSSSSFNNFTQEATSVSIPSTANGGISSSSSGGGGCSGGGGGGGGGGSW